MMSYQQTHPWIAFRIDLRKAGPKFWMFLGEAASKCEHIAGVPLRPETAKHLHQVYLAKGVQATTAIEGNTLSEKEVLQHIEGKLTLPPSKEYLAQEIDNIITAFNQIRDRLKAGDDSLTSARVLEFNRQALEKLQLDKEVAPGKIREHSVVVGNVYRGAPAEDCSYLLDRLCEWINGPEFAPPKGLEAMYAVIKAVTAHVYMAWIHPFGDGNGRTARLVELQILLAAGIPTPAAHLLSNHYNQTRTEYYRQLDRASKSGGDLIPFLEYAAQGFVDGLREQLQTIRAQQWDVAWENYVHQMFRDKTGTTARRRRHLVLDLSQVEGPVAVGKIADLTPRLAREYAPKTSKTLQRDLNALDKMSILERSAKGVRPKREIILAFLPWRKPAAAGAADSHGKNPGEPHE